MNSLKQLTKEKREEHLRKLREKRDKHFYQGNPPTIN